MLIFKTIGEFMETTNTGPFKRAKRITAEIVKLSDFDAGYTIQGKYITRTERPWVDKNSGEEKIIPVFVFENQKGERFTVFGDAGLVNAMSGAAVKENQWIEIEKLDQVDLGGGKRVNSYDIYALEH